VKEKTQARLVHKNVSYILSHNLYNLLLKPRFTIW